MRTVAAPGYQSMIVELLRIEDQVLRLSAPPGRALHRLLDEATTVLERLRTRFQETGDGAGVECTMTASALLARAEDEIRQTRHALRQGEDGRALLLQALPVLHAARVAVEGLAGRRAGASSATIPAARTT